MATRLEVQIWQRDKLYSLLKLRAVNKGNKIIDLDEMINATEAMMDAEDVAWVEKKIAEVYGNVT